MKKITPDELRQWINDHKPFILIDVREVFERDAFHIGGTHIPVGEIISRKDELDKSADTVLYCEKGIRSAIAIQRLEALGFTNLVNLEGGMHAWKNSLC